LSDARNVGVQHATGQYITFVDSDDYIDQSTFEEVMHILIEHPEYDMIEYPIYIHYGDKNREKILSFEQKEYKDPNSYWLEAKAYLHAYACNKIFKKRVFNHVSFPVGRFFEDVHTLPCILKEAKVVATTDKGMYYYVNNPHGITMNADGKALNDLLEAHLNVLPGLSDASYYAHVLNIQMDVYEKTGASPRLPVLPYYSTWKLQLLHLIGLKRLCRFNKTLHLLMNKRS
jgi:glycosyltransferase involved in cell wall biosynthesis